MNLPVFILATSLVKHCCHVFIPSLSFLTALYRVSVLNWSTVVEHLLN